MHHLSQLKASLSTLQSFLLQNVIMAHICCKFLVFRPQFLNLRIFYSSDSIRCSLLPLSAALIETLLSLLKEANRKMCQKSRNDVRVHLIKRFRKVPAKNRILSNSSTCSNSSLNFTVAQFFSQNVCFLKFFQQLQTANPLA